MEPISNPRHVAEQMLLADGLLGALEHGRVPTHASGYQELARWVRASFASLGSAELRLVRDAAPPELRDIAENVLHDRRVISWAVSDVVGLSAYATCQSLLARLRRRDA